MLQSCAHVHRSLRGLVFLSETCWLSFQTHRPPLHLSTTPALEILAGALSVVLSLASAQTQQQQQQQGQRQVLSFGAEGDTSDIGGVFRRHLRGSPTGFGLSETVTTTTTPAKMTVSRGDLRSAEGAEAPAGKRARERGGGFGVLESAEGGGIRGVTAGATVPGGASREESERKAARAREVKQGSRGSNKR